MVTNGTPRRRRSGSAGSPYVGSITITPSSGTRSHTNQSAPGGETTSAWSRPMATAVAAEISSEKKPNSLNATGSVRGSDGMAAIRPVRPETSERAAGLGR